ncbi:hypothetical protein [Pseudomonas sp.]|uniref:hypothetical protein n=1 Tax=Pseudomonas sp. TaxID=306 RepID=UPI003D1403A5
MYPFKKVVIAFALCPALVGVFIFTYFATAALLSPTADMNAAEAVFGMLGFGALSALVAELFYGVPAFLLALVYASCKLQRCVQHVCVVCLAGGVAAMGWGELLPLGSDALVNGFLGATTSFLIALYALPKRTEF